MIWVHPIKGNSRSVGLGRQSTLQSCILNLKNKLHSCTGSYRHIVKVIASIPCEFLTSAKFIPAGCCLQSFSLDQISITSSQVLHLECKHVITISSRRQFYLEATNISLQNACVQLLNELSRAVDWRIKHSLSRGVINDARNCTSLLIRTELVLNLSQRECITARARLRARLILSATISVRKVG